MTTEQLPPLGPNDSTIWDRPPTPPGGPAGRVALVVALIVVVALAGLGLGWLFGGSTSGARDTASTTPTPSGSAAGAPASSAGPSQPASQIERGRTSDFGYFVAARTSRGVTHITFDRAQLFTGQAARDYAKAHHLDQPPNDYLIINENPRTRDLVLGPNVTVTGTTILAGTNNLTPVPLQTLLNAIPANGRQMPLEVRYDKAGYVIAVTEPYFA